MWLILLRPATTSCLLKLEASLTFPASCVICMVHRRVPKQLSVIFFHSHCLTQLISPIPNSGHLEISTHPSPPSLLFLQKVTRSHRRCARLLCGCHDNHGGLHTGLMYGMAVMDWTLGAARRNYTFRRLSIFFVPAQWNGWRDREGQGKMSAIFSHTKAHIIAG